MGSPPASSPEKFDSASACCSKGLWWIRPADCIADTDGVSSSASISSYTNKFYISHYHSKCAQDCDPTQGLPCMGSPPASSPERYDSATACCSKGLWWIAPADCIADTNGATDSESISSYTNKFYIAHFHSRCSQDCDPAQGLPCMGSAPASSPERYDSVTACCSKGLWWIAPADCIANTNGASDSESISSYTNKFYISHYHSKCAQDCDPAQGLPCMGSAPASSPERYDSASVCCSKGLWWIAPADCIADTNGEQQI